MEVSEFMCWTAAIALEPVKERFETKFEEEVERISKSMKAL